MKTQIIENLASISDQYDSYIIDIYGVVFDGKNLVDSGIDAIYSLMEKEKNIVFLSNSPRPGHIVKKRLYEKAYTSNAKEVFSKTPIFTSGDVFSHTICNYYLYDKKLWQNDENMSFLDGRGFVVGAGHDHHLIQEIDNRLATDNQMLRLTSNIHNSSYIIMLGFFSSTTKNVETILDNILLQAANRDLVCLCPNPDKLAPDGKDQLHTSGFYANRYTEIYGKKSIYFGKPFRMAYDLIFSNMPYIVDTKVLCIGDSLHHDIAGAIALGYDSLFIRNSIHQNLSYKTGEEPSYEICILS